MVAIVTYIGNISWDVLCSKGVEEAFLAHIFTLVLNFWEDLGYVI